MGLQIGYTEREMYYGKWYDLFREFKEWHNFKTKKGLFEKKEIVSMLALEYNGINKGGGEDG